MFCLFLCTEGGCSFHQDRSRKQMAHSSGLIWGESTKESIDSSAHGSAQGQCSARGWWPWGTGLHLWPQGERQESFLTDRDPAREQDGQEEGTLGQRYELSLREVLVLHVLLCSGWKISPEPPSLEMCGQGGPLRDAHWDLRMMWWASLSLTHPHLSAGSAPGLRQSLGQVRSISPWFLLQLLPLPG